MNAPRPPHLALWLLNSLLPENEPLIGDLLEEFQRRRSRGWFWRQAIAAIVLSRRSSRHELTTVRLSDKVLPVRYEEVHLPIKLSASPFPIAGGLGITSLGVVVAIYRPGMWWFVLAAVLGGIVLGIVRVVIVRRRFLADPGRFITTHSITPR